MDTCGELPKYASHFLQGATPIVNAQDVQTAFAVVGSCSSTAATAVLRSRRSPPPWMPVHPPAGEEGEKGHDETANVTRNNVLELCGEGIGKTVITTGNTAAPEGEARPSSAGGRPCGPTRSDRSPVDDIPPPPHRPHGGYQDTLYAENSMQLYSLCDIARSPARSSTTACSAGSAKAVFQSCRRAGFIFQRCNVPSGDGIGM